jgi:23S rRNA (adenine2030-N6)-methyltransferase
MSDSNPSAIPSGPLPARASDYAHARHSGNVGDVFKHVALTATLNAFKAPPELYAESHAGDGLYSLGSVGEWTSGLQKVWTPTDSEFASSTATEKWLSVVRSFASANQAKPDRLPGSPLLAQSLLPASTKLSLHELDPQAAAVLRRALSARNALEAGAREVHEADGFAGVVDALRAANGSAAAALIDPPYTNKHEWQQAAECLAKCAEAAPQAALLLWYPIKALTRPRGLLAELVKLGVHGTLVELITTPLRLKREKLCGSGMVLVHPPAGAVEALLAELPRLGTAMMTHGEWSGTQIGF